MVYAIDGRERWLVHNYLKPDEADFDSVDRDACLRTILGVGADFKYEIISKEDWYGRRLIADKFRDRCAFIAGDAAHIWVPYAGYGMNAGIADAMNLSWLLAAHLNGWAPAAILDAYEAERWPITSQVSRFAMSHAEAEIRRRGAVPDEIEDAGTGRRARARGRSGVWPTRSTSSNMPAPASTSAPITIARRSSPMMAPSIRPTRWTSTRRRPCRAAARRICGARTAARSTTRWGRSSRCCGSIRRSMSRRSRRRRAQGHAAEGTRCRERPDVEFRFYEPDDADWFYRGRTNMWPGAATGYPAIPSH